MARLEDDNPDVSTIYEEPELYLDSRRERSTCRCRCRKSATESRRSCDVSAQKSRSRSKGSVADRKDEDCRTTKSMSRSAEATFDREENSREDFQTSSHSRELSQVSPKDENSDSSGRFSRRQGTGTRRRSNEAISRPRTKKTPENLAYLCLRAICENVMRRAERIRDRLRGRREILRKIRNLPAAKYSIFISE
ncbi:hypothetical protein K0M31_019765 [Melipona bicolor]|uniref:Uncharacterized protein n=1 Tax=Melipona bicolor TaxID=60889 RepID=A0AA40KRG8_9HYME|nr:hypothetical protein K0M31_019765 [Melipona bicolor]